MTTPFAKAFRLYTQYKTQTAAYRELAAQLGHTTGSLNAAMSAETYRRSRG